MPNVWHNKDFKVYFPFRKSIWLWFWVSFFGILVKFLLFKKYIPKTSWTQTNDSQSRSCIVSVYFLQENLHLSRCYQKQLHLRFANSLLVFNICLYLPLWSFIKFYTCSLSQRVENAWPYQVGEILLLPLLKISLLKFFPLTLNIEVN